MLMPAANLNRYVAPSVFTNEVNLHYLVDDLNEAIRTLQARQFAVSEHQLELIVANLQSILQKG